MQWVTILAMLVLLEYLYFGLMVGRARGRSGVQAPHVTGNDEFERYFRAHQNTLEQLIIFLPGLYASAYFVGTLYAVVVGLVFLVGRGIYFRNYVLDPTGRGPGMLMTAVANLALILGGLIGSISHLFW